MWTAVFWCCDFLLSSDAKSINTVSKFLQALSCQTISQCYESFFHLTEIVTLTVLRIFCTFNASWISLLGLCFARLFRILIEMLPDAIWSSFRKTAMHLNWNLSSLQWSSSSCWSLLLYCLFVHSLQQFAGFAVSCLYIYFDRSYHTHERYTLHWSMLNTAFRSLFLLLRIAIRLLFFFLSAQTKYDRHFVYKWSNSIVRCISWLGLHCQWWCNASIWVSTLGVLRM